MVLQDKGVVYEILLYALCPCSPRRWR